MLLSPATVYRRGRYGRRGRRGRPVVLVRGQEPAGDEVYSDDDAEYEFDDAEGSYSEDSESWYDMDDAGEEYIDNLGDIAFAREMQQAEAPAPSAAEAAPNEADNFFSRHLAAHGMLGHEDPDSHPSSKQILPVKAAGDRCAEPVIVECVEIVPCDPETKDEECSSESSESSAYDEKPACEDKEVDVTHGDEDSKIEPDYTLAYDCWVSKGTKAKPTDKASPDDCDPKPKDKCNDYESMRLALNEAMKSGKPFKGSMKSEFKALDSKGSEQTQKTQLRISGEYKKRAYAISVQIAPLNNKDAEIKNLRSEAPLVSVKLDAKNKFRARAISSGVKKLKEQKTPVAAIQHAVLIVQGLVE